MIKERISRSRSLVFRDHDDDDSTMTIRPSGDQESRVITGMNDDEDTDPAIGNWTEEDDVRRSGPGVPKGWNDQKLHEEYSIIIVL